MDTTGRHELVAPAPARDLQLSYYARYSPDGKLLAVQAEYWFQVVRIVDKQTLIFRSTEVETIGLSPPTWIDDNRLVVGFSRNVVLVDVATRAMRSLVKNRLADAMVYSPTRRLLYAILDDPDRDTGDGVLCSIDPSTGATRQLEWAKKKNVFDLYGVTAGGQLAIVEAVERTRPQATGSSSPDLWAVDLDTGDWMPIAGDVTRAVVLPPPLGHE